MSHTPSSEDADMFTCTHRHEHVHVHTGTRKHANIHTDQTTTLTQRNGPLRCVSVELGSERTLIPTLTLTLT